MNMNTKILLVVMAIALAVVAVEVVSNFNIPVISGVLGLSENKEARPYSVGNMNYIVNYTNFTETGEIADIPAYIKRLKEAGMSDEQITNICPKYLFVNEGKSAYSFRASDESAGTEGTWIFSVESASVETSDYVVRKDALELQIIDNETGSIPPSIILNATHSIYLRPDSMSCVFELETVSLGSRHYDENYDCKGGRYANYSRFGGCITEFEFLKAENATVPAGRFSTDVYIEKKTNITYWDAGLPFPVKIIDGTMEYDLLSYTIQ